MTRGCSKALGILFAVLFVITGVISFLFYQLEYRILQPEPYINAIHEGDLPSRLTEVAARELAGRLDLDPCALTPDVCSQVGGPPVYFTQLGEQDWRQILDLLVTPDWISSQADHVVRAAFRALDPAQDDASVTIDLSPVKAQLRGAAGPEIINLMLASLPACTPDQIARLGQLLISGGSVEQLLVCSPPPELLTIAMPILRGQLSNLTAELPDQIVLDLEGIREVRGAPGQDNIGDLRRSLRSGFLVSIAVAGGSLLLMLLFAVRSPGDLVSWLAWPLSLIGVVTLLISLGLRASTGLVFGSLLSVSDAGLFQAGTFEFLRDLLDVVIGNVLRGAITLSLGFVVVGVVLLILSRLFLGKPDGVQVGQRPDNLY